LKVGRSAVKIWAD